MKKYLLLPGLLVSAISSFGQSASQFEHSVYQTRTSNATGIVRKADQAASWKAKLPGWSAEADLISGTVRDLYGAAVTISGNTTQEKFNYCLNNIIPTLGISQSEFAATGINETPVGSFSRYRQQLNGHVVVFSMLTIRLTKEGKLASIQNKYYGNTTTASAPSITKEDALKTATADLSGATIDQQSADANWVWFPVPANGSYELHPAYAFSVTGKNKTTELQLSGYVDGVTGALLYRTNNVKETFDVTIKGNVYKENPTLPATTEPLANLLLTINSASYYTDSVGNLNTAALSLPQTANVALRGKWSTVRAIASSNVTPSYSLTPATNGLVDTFSVAAPSTPRHVNAYYHVNRVHDFMKKIFPSFTGLDVSLQTNVDVTGTCNAFYNGSSINFFAAGGGCNSFANCGDIIYHEYGHGISDRFYSSQNAGTIYNGALNEACSDIWGISISHNPIIGLGSSNGSASYIRRYDQAPKVYPADIVGEVHGDGEIIAGAWWDVAVNLGSVDTMTKIFTNTYYFTPDGANGTEGAVYHDVLMAALQVDDNDANLSNGTPHFTQIVTAFAKHGIYLLYGLKATSGEPAHQPAGVTIPVTGGVTVANPIFIQNMKLFYKSRAASTWDSAALNISNQNFTGQIPSQIAGTIIDYYIAIYDIAGITSSYLPEGYNPTITGTLSTIPYQFGVGIYAKDSNNFENNVTGWLIGNNTGDNATTGIWINDAPVGSFASTAQGSVPCQPGFDHTTGSGKCLVTGNAGSTTVNINTADVDNGITTVITPAIDVSTFYKPIIEYYRWFSNDLGANPKNDRWLVNIKDAAGTLWFQSVENTYQPDNKWRRRIFFVKDYLPASASIQLKFVASDAIVTTSTANGQSTVEAAVDDFYIYDAAFPTSVQNQAIGKANVYPNPADNTIMVSLPSASATGIIGLYDVTGKKITEQVITDGTKQYQFQTGKLAAGHYTILIKTAGSIESKGVIVAH